METSPKIPSPRFSRGLRTSRGKLLTGVRQSSSVRTVSSKLVSSLGWSSVTELLTDSPRPSSWSTVPDFSLTQVSFTQSVHSVANGNIWQFNRTTVTRRCVCLTSSRPGRVRHDLMLQPGPWKLVTQRKCSSMKRNNYLFSTSRRNRVCNRQVPCLRLKHLRTSPPHTSKSNPEMFYFFEIWEI